MAITPTTEPTTLLLVWGFVDSEAGRTDGIRTRPLRVSPRGGVAGSMPGSSRRASQVQARGRLNEDAGGWLWRRRFRDSKERSGLDGGGESLLGSALDLAEQLRAFLIALLTWWPGVADFHRYDVWRVESSPSFASSSSIWCLTRSVCLMVSIDST